MTKLGFLIRESQVLETDWQRNMYLTGRRMRISVIRSSGSIAPTGGESVVAIFELRLAFLSGTVMLRLFELLNRL